MPLIIDVPAEEAPRSLEHLLVRAGVCRLAAAREGHLVADIEGVGTGGRVAGRNNDQEVGVWNSPSRGQRPAVDDQPLPLGSQLDRWEVLRGQTAFAVHARGRSAALELRSALEVPGIFEIDALIRRHGA